MYYRPKTFRRNAADGKNDRLMACAHLAKHDDASTDRPRGQGWKQYRSPAPCTAICMIEQWRNIIH